MYVIENAFTLPWLCQQYFYVFHHINVNICM